ncbi:hypothetical protein IJX73_02040 [bacterium]|nr:hypothetical protein [bacterium]MBQ9149689.1 hypothetical protein [bacterium]
MENFRPINNINTQNISQTKAGLVQNSQNQPIGQQTPQAQPQIQTPQQNQTINPSLMFDFSTIKMDNETALKYLQNLLKLPNSIDKFVNQLNSKNVDPKIAAILVENMISVKALSEFLNQNSTTAISKLLQTISMSLKSGISDVSQLKEILSVLNAIQTNSNLSTNTIKELLLLYIPLNNPVFDKEIDPNDFMEDAEENIKNAKISLLFETINFSNILCTLNESDNNLLIDIYAISDFPKDKFKSIIQALSKEASINPLIEFSEKQHNKTNEIQNFKILSDGFISSNTLILSHLIIKTIFKLDDDFNSI